MILQPGDILLWRVVPGLPLYERFIGWSQLRVLKQKGVTGQQYYHCALVAANPKSYYSSQPPKIDKFVLPDPLPSNVEVWRLNEPLDPLKLALVFQYAESRRGKWYPLLGVITAGWLQGNQEFCSQYLEDSYAHYPVLLCNDIRFATPDGIALGVSQVASLVPLR